MTTVVQAVAIAQAAPGRAQTDPSPDRRHAEPAACDISRTTGLTKTGGAIPPPIPLRFRALFKHNPCGMQIGHQTWLKVGGKALRNAGSAGDPQEGIQRWAPAVKWGGDQSQEPRAGTPGAAPHGGGSAHRAAHACPGRARAGTHDAPGHLDPDQGGRAGGSGEPVLGGGLRANHPDRHHDRFEHPAFWV
jgi:hypothetical protein